MNEPEQLDLFGWKPPKAKVKTEDQPKIDIENERRQLKLF